MTDIYYDGGNLALGTSDAQGKQLHVAGLARFAADGAGRVESIEVLNGNAQQGDEPSVVFLGRTEGLAAYRLGSIGGIVEENAGFVRKGGLVFRTSNNDGANGETLYEVMRIDSEGRVGIRNTSPVAPYDLQVGSNDGRIRAGYLHVDSSAYISQSGDLNEQNDIGMFTEGVERVTIANNGDVGISTPDPSYPLHVTGTLFVNGDAIKTDSASDWTVSSDARLKTNIAPLSDVLSQLLALRGVTYEWIEPEKHGNRTGPQTGMIAQEVEGVFPDWVGTDRDGFKTLTIRGFEALAVESFRELKNENDALRREVSDLAAKAERTAKLEADLAAERAAREKLEARLAAIEARLSATSPAAKPAAPGPAKSSSRLGF